MTDPEVIAEWTGPDYGIPSRALMTGHTGNLAELRALQSRGGCGAWKGRTACDAEPVYLVIGSANLTFSMYRTSYRPNKPAYALACERHFPDVKRDMPDGLRKSQRKELLKLLESLGVEEDPMFMAVRIDEIGSETTHE